MVNKIRQIIEKIIYQNLEIDLSNKSMTESLVTELDLDSLSLLQILVEIEVQFDIELYDEELVPESLNSLENIVNIVENHIKKAN